MKSAPGVVEKRYFGKLRLERPSAEQVAQVVLEEDFSPDGDGRLFGGIYATAGPGGTIITQEYPRAHDETNEPYYPTPFGEGMALYQPYKKLADAEPRPIFLGRLATYSYLNMWMAVAQAFVKLRHGLAAPFRDRLIK